MDRFRRIGRSVATLPAWIALALLAVPAILAYAQTSGLFTLTWSGAEGGGVTTSSGGTFTMDGTIGQPEAGTVGGGAFSLSGGFQGGGVSLPSNYAINQTAGNTPVPCNNLIPDSQCRDCVRGFEAPFPIELYGEQFNGGSAGSDGTFELGNDLQVSPSRVLTTNTCLPATGFGPTIFPLWAYLDMSTTTTTTLGIYTTTQGSAPNRTFVVEWRACLYNGGTCGGYVNFEVIFHEDNPGTFDIIYGELAGGANDATVGVQSADGQTTQFQCGNGTLAQGVGLNFQRVPSLPNGPTNTPTNTITPTRTNSPTNTPTNTPTRTNTPCVPSCTPTATPTPCGGGPNWIVGNPFPGNVARAVGVWFPANGKFYALGGRSAEASGNELLNPREFTPGGQGTWTTKSALFDDDQVNNMAAAVLTQGGTPYIFTVGGSHFGATSTSNEVRRYDPVGNVITAVSTDPWPISPVSLLPGGFAVYNNKLYILGGFDVNALVASTNIWEFDPNSLAGSMWQLKGASLPVALAYVPATTIGSYIYTAGGDTVVGGSLQDAAHSYRYDPVGDSITGIANIPRATGETRALNVDGQMWVLGGGRISPNPSNEVNIYNPGTDSWTTGISFTGARRNFPADTRPGAGDRIYLVGGYQPTTPSSDMQIYNLSAPCLPTFTPTSTTTRTFTRTATPTFCPPVLRVIGPGDPGKPAASRKPANAQNNPAAAPGGGKPVRAGKLPDNPTNASAAFELDDGTRETSIGFGSTVNNTESAAVWVNRFSPPNGAYPITINQVHILWPAQSPTLTDTIIGKTARLLIYRANAPGAPITNTTLMYQQFVTVGVTETFQTYNLSSPPTIAGVNGEDLYIGFEDFWAESGTFQPRFFPAAQDTTPPSQVRSWVVGNSNAGPPNVGNLGDPTNDTIGTIDSFGLPGNWMIRASGSTSLPDPCPATRTPTPAVTPVLVVHILFQGIPTPNPVRYITDTVTTTLRLASGGPNIEYGPIGPDGFGFYTIPVGSLPSGTYIIRAKGYKNLSSGTTSCDTVTLTGALTTQKELGTLRAGDALTTGATNFNVVNASDFTTLKNTFGKAFGQPGYDHRADFNQSNNVDASDFSLQKGNFGSAGCPNP